MVEAIEYIAVAQCFRCLFRVTCPTGIPPSMLSSMYGLEMGTDATADEETAKALAAAAAAVSTSAHSAFPFGMYNPLQLYTMMATQGMGMSASQSYAQAALSSAGIIIYSVVMHVVVL